jgi:LPS sulfotransferase NodH
MSQRPEELFSSVQVVAEKLEKLRRMPKAQKQLVIYFTPRSGSSWLTEVLSQTNRIGRANEVFNPGFIPNIAQACNATSLADYIDLVQRRLNTHGVFSFEITWHQLKAVFGNGDAFMENFGTARPAWLIRQDIVAQAVSLAKMVTTKVAHSTAADAEQRQQADSTFTYDPALIRRWLLHILVAERGTETHFTEHGIKPLRLSYEGMMAAGGEQMRACFAQYMDITGIPELATASSHSKLATSQNADYATRFRNDEAAFLRDVDEERADWLTALNSSTSD